jgi:hypothetical protein
MKFIFRLILIAVLGYFLPFYLPWWILFVVAFSVGALIPGNGFNVFNAGFLGGGLVWMGLSFKIDMETNSILSEKMVELFPIADATFLLIAAGIIGALVGGFGAITGNSLRQIFMKKPKPSFYS